MAFPVTTGAAAYSGNFIPEIWASKLIVNFYDSTVLSAISNTDYEGEIKSMGDKVNIRTTPELTIRQYEKGMTLQVERPDKPKIVLNIDQGDYFAAIEDDVDKVQSDIALLDAWTKDAAERMKIRIDAVVLSGMLADVDIYNKGATAGRISQNINLGATGAPVQVTKSNVLDYIIDMGVVLDEANAPSDNRFLVIPAWMAGLIKKSDLKDASLAGDATSIMRNGRLGMINDMMLYVSHNLNKVVDGANNAFSAIGGNKMGFTFATQMTEMESIRAESTFGNIIRGLQVYGFKVTKGEALATLYAYQ